MHGHVNLGGSDTLLLSAFACWVGGLLSYLLALGSGKIRGVPRAVVSGMWMSIIVGIVVGAGLAWMHASDAQYPAVPVKTVVWCAAGMCSLGFISMSGFLGYLMGTGREV